MVAEAQRPENSHKRMGAKGKGKRVKACAFRRVVEELEILED